MPSPVFLFDAEFLPNVPPIGYAKIGNGIFVIIELLHQIDDKFPFISIKERKLSLLKQILPPCWFFSGI
jgi:hypothetical protein